MEKVPRRPRERSKYSFPAKFATSRGPVMELSGCGLEAEMTISVAGVDSKQKDGMTE